MLGPEGSSSCFLLQQFSATEALLVIAGLFPHVPALPCGWGGEERGDHQRPTTALSLSRTVGWLPALEGESPGPLEFLTPG